jgi:hypothetical protein
MKESGSFDFTGPGPVPALLVLFTQVHADTDKGVVDGKRARLQGGASLKSRWVATPAPKASSSLRSTKHQALVERAARREGRGVGAAMASEGNGKEKEEDGEGSMFVPPEIRFTRLFIDGCFVDAVSGACLLC